jgi:uncharacterized membrane-anchored protein
MCCSSQSHPGRTLAKLVVCGLLLNSGMFSRYCSAADSSSLVPVVPQPVEWLSGPVDASLADVAVIRVPSGFRFTDAKGARILLESAHNRVPEGLAGLIAPVSGDWWITFDYANSGHVSTSDQNKLDQDALIKAYWTQIARERKAQGLPELTHINWEAQPSWHAARQYFDYSARLEGFSAKDQKLAYVARFLGRRGVLQAKVVRSWNDREDAGVFKNALLGFPFKQGERYDDFQKGDKIAAGALSELITADNSSAETPASHLEAASGMKAFWIGFGAIGFVGIAGIALIARKFKGKNATAPAVTVSESEPAAVAPVSRPVIAPKPFKLNVKPKSALKPVNGNGHSNGNGNNGKRGRRMFNYHKFYTEMVLQGPAPTIAEPVNGFNGYPSGHDDRFANGNGHSNGNGNGTNGQESSGAAVHAHSELIANQKALIEEQKRLIHEQARLIEEKSKLISEKNQLLDRQSQMIDNNLL